MYRLGFGHAGHGLLGVTGTTGDPAQGDQHPADAPVVAELPDHRQAFFQRGPACVEPTAARQRDALVADAAGFHPAVARAPGDSSASSNSATPRSPSPRVAVAGGRPGAHVDAAARTLHGRRGQRRILAQYGLFELPQLGARFDAQLLHEPAPSLAVRLQRLGLAAGPVQRDHEAPPQTLPQRVVTDHRTKLSHQLTVPPQSEIGVETILERGQAQLLQPADLRGDGAGQPLARAQHRPPPAHAQVRVHGEGGVGTHEQVLAARYPADDALPGQVRGGPPRMPDVASGDRATGRDRVQPGREASNAVAFGHSIRLRRHPARRPR